MKEIFRFSTKDSFHSEDSFELAKLLLAISPKVRRSIKETFGLRVEIDSDPPRVIHDGRRIGIGSFLSGGTGIKFAVGTKTDEAALKNIYQALEGKPGMHRYAKFGNISSISPTEAGEDDFTPAYLLRLLDEIVDSSMHLLGASYRKREIDVIGGIRGRPRVRKLAKEIEMGKYWQFPCEVLDNTGLKEYAQALLETARSITTQLEDWHDLVPTHRLDSISKLRFIAARFGSLTSVSFNPSTLFKLCRSPFPYGLRSILYKCLRYWQWRMGFRMADVRDLSLGYYHLVVQMDSLFEMYVGEVWSESLGNDFEWEKGPSYSYQINGMNEVSDDRVIMPDHCYLHRPSNTLFVVDAKYRVDVGSRDQIYQMLSYLSFNYPHDITQTSHDKNGQIIGVLVYPGTEWEIGEITGFDQRLFCARLPITQDLQNLSIVDLVSSIIYQEAVALPQE